MSTEEAIEVCKQWLQFLDKQRQRAVELQRLAALARTGPDGQKEAKQRLLQLDNTPRVFGGERLEPAVQQLIKAASGKP